MFNYSLDLIEECRLAHFEPILAQILYRYLCIITSYEGLRLPYPVSVLQWSLFATPPLDFKVVKTIVRLRNNQLDQKHLHPRQILL